jgi:two-component system, NarL family, sensor kinase
MSNFTCNLHYLQTMRKNLLTYCIALLLVSIFSCNSNTKDTTKASVENWYAKQRQFVNINNDSVLHYSKLIEKNSEHLPVEYHVMGLIGKATYHSIVSPSLAIKEYNHMLNLLANSKADTLKARIYNGLGVCHKKMTEFPAAFDYYFKALSIFEKSNDKKAAAGVLSNIGELYQLKDDVITAKRYVQQAMKMNKESGNTTYYLTSAQTLANIYGMTNQFDSALAIDNMGIAASDSIGSTNLKSIFYNNKGNCYMYMGRYDSASYFFNQCVLLDSANSNVLYMADNYSTLGALALQQKKYDEAEKYFRYSIVLGDSTKNNQIKYQSFIELAGIYTIKNNFSAALIAKDSAAVIKDRIINEKSENKIAELKEIYEGDKKEQTISLQQVKLNNQRLIIIGGIIVFILLLLLSWLFYRRYKLKREKELQQSIIKQREEATINILTAEEKERKRIAADLHDGVGQLITAAWLNLQVMEKQDVNNEQKELLAKTTLLVGESCKEVRQVSHNMMPNALLKKGLLNAIKEFTQQIDKSVIAISLQAEGLNTELNSITETILYRVVQECVNNTIKHSAATELDISIHNSNSGIDVLIEDNGKGFNTTFISEGKEGLGLQNIRSRISFLKGTVDWDSSPGNGTVVAIHIPPNQ